MFVLSQHAVRHVLMLGPFKGKSRSTEIVRGTRWIKGGRDPGIIIGIGLMGNRKARYRPNEGLSGDAREGLTAPIGTGPRKIA